jgi:thiol-disulfide isomerase/thioredoxin
MNAVSFGPFAFETERLAVVVGLVVFLATASVLAHRFDARLGSWSSMTALAGIGGARLGHVLQHLDSFAVEPWRVLAVWQGGFSWTGAAAGVVVMLVVPLCRTRSLAAWGALSVAAGVVATSSTLLIAGTDSQLPPSTAIFQSSTGGGRTIGANGRPVVLNLWASWCPPCRRELPMMSEIASSTDEVEFVFANQGEAPSVMSAYLRDNDLSLPGAVLDPELLLSRHYSAVGLPATLFLAADGTLAASHLGEISREVLEQQVQELKNQKGTEQ